MAAFQKLSELLRTHLAQPGIHLYFMRHGQSMANHSGSVVGWTDSKLSVRGREQANQLYRAFHPHIDTFTHLHSSDLSRAVDTLNLALGFTTRKVAQSKLLRQLHYGEDEGLHFDSLPADQKAKINTLEYQAPGGENWRQATKRALMYLKQLEEGHHLIGSHGGLMCALGHHLGLKHVVQNCSVVGMELCPSKKDLTKLNFIWEFEKSE